jgi:hypothetical protein
VGPSRLVEFDWLAFFSLFLVARSTGLSCKRLSVHADRTNEGDATGVSDAQSLVSAFENFEFLIGKIIWHNILFIINTVSKKLQYEIVCIDATLKQIERVISYFQKYRDESFKSSTEVAKGIASDMDIEPKFPTKRQGKRKKHFDEINDQDEEIQLLAMESFRANYFLVIVDTAIALNADEVAQVVSGRAILNHSHLHTHTPTQARTASAPSETSKLCSVLDWLAFFSTWLD